MTFRSQMVTDASVFVNSNEFAEQVEYDLDGAKVGTGDVYALVFREAQDAEPSDRNFTYQDRARMVIKKADLSNLASKPKAEFKFPEIEGGSPSVWWRVVEIENKDDNALWYLWVAR